MSTTFTFTSSLPRRGPGVAVCVASGISGGAPLPQDQEDGLRNLLAARKAPGLNEAEEKLRAGCRHMLRNGIYKPTGRGKPASEYLLGAAREGAFPRVSSPVDINNLISLKYMLPVSLWDADLCSSSFEFRLGRADERYVFNSSGQKLDLEDLVCGCEAAREGSLPIVTPIKDGMRTKIRPETRTVIGAIYYPADVLGEDKIAAINSEFMRGLCAISEGAAGGTAELLPGETKTITLEAL